MTTHTRPRALLWLLIGVCVLAGCDRRAKSSRPRIAYVTNGIDSFWTIAKAGAMAAGGTEVG